MVIVFSFGVAFWLRQIYQPKFQEIPDTIVVGTTADYPPFAFKKDDQIIGFDIDVITETIKRLGKNIAIKDTPFELLIPQTSVGVTHVVAANLAITPERQKLVLFTQPYLSNNPLVVVSLAKNPAFTSLHDLADKRVAVNAGYTADDVVSKLPHIAVQRVPSIAEALHALRTDKVDACVINAHNVAPIFEEFGNENFHTLVLNDVDENAALAVSKMHPQLAKALDDILTQMQNDGTLDQLKEKWHVQ